MRARFVSIGYFCLTAVFMISSGLAKQSFHSRVMPPLVNLEDPYPSPPTPESQQEAGESSAGLNYLPFVTKPQDHFYAQGRKRYQDFYGIWANISTADPIIREPYFSYMSIVILGPNSMWVEIGWTKIKLPETGCVPLFSWATQEYDGRPIIIVNPKPTVGFTYGYMIFRVSPGLWRIRILDMSGYVLVEIDVPNPGMDYGIEIQGSGEVQSLNKLNDMGISSARSLLWKRQDGFWQAWSNWDFGVVDYPYWVSRDRYDPNAYIQVGGNQGNPVPPDAPCP